MRMAQLFKVISDDPERIGKWVASRMGTKWWCQHAAIGFERDGELVAGIVYDNFNGKNIFAHIAAVPNKRWLTKEFLCYMCYYPFNQLKVERVTGLIPSNNKASIKFVEKLGAELETTLKDAHPKGDLLVYRMNKKDCKYLGVSRWG